MNRLCFFLGIISLIVLIEINFSFAEEKFYLNLNLKNFESNEGQAIIHLCNSQSNYSDFKGEPFKKQIHKINNNKVNCKFENLLPGEYAVKVFHDADSNGEMTRSFLGMPIEDYGFSNGARGSFGPPTWEETKFELKEDKSITIKID